MVAQREILLLFSTVTREKEKKEFIQGKGDNPKPKQVGSDP